MIANGIRGAWLAAVMVLASLAGAGEKTPILLVPGMTWDLDSSDDIWGYPVEGKPGTGMVGYLQTQGYPFGGVIRPDKGKVELPKCIDTYAIKVHPRKAAVFELEFSKSAHTDGLAYKAAELAETVKQLCRYTGAKKVRVVCHSAGGLAARVYLQDALPGVKYRGDVERLITIATPHLGSEIAEHWGDFLGTRATSLKPTAGLIRQLNDTLELPSDVRFASIVVRGIGADADGDGEELDELVDQEYLAKLPIGYRIGGDQVVHVRSQNLRLARCTARYEKRTGRPVHYSLAGVPDPSPEDNWPAEARVHCVATANSTVQKQLKMFLEDDLWGDIPQRRWAARTHQQLRTHIEGAVLDASLDLHFLSDAQEVEIQRIDILKQKDKELSVRFSGDAYTVNKYIPFRKRWTRVEGDLTLKFDEFARVIDSEVEVEEVDDI